MSYQQAIPGDPWVICDTCGFKTRMSQTRKTWNGLRVCLKDWEPKHPLLNIRGKIDRQAVHDARPELPDTFITISYDWGSFCLISPNGTYYIVTIADDGAMLVVPGVLPGPQLFLHLGNYHYSVDDDGALLPSIVSTQGAIFWRMVSPGGYAYLAQAAPDGAITITPQ